MIASQAVLQRQNQKPGQHTVASVQRWSPLQLHPLAFPVAGVLATPELERLCARALQASSRLPVHVPEDLERCAVHLAGMRARLGQPLGPELVHALRSLVAAEASAHARDVRDMAAFCLGFAAPPTQPGFGAEQASRADGADDSAARARQAAHLKSRKEAMLAQMQQQQAAALAEMGDSDEDMSSAGGSPDSEPEASDLYTHLFRPLGSYQLAEDQVCCACHEGSSMGSLGLVTFVKRSSVPYQALRPFESRSPEEGGTAGAAAVREDPPLTQGLWEALRWGGEQQPPVKHEYRQPMLVPGPSPGSILWDSALSPGVSMVDLAVGVHMHTCGHLLHASCLQNLKASQLRNLLRLPGRDSQHLDLRSGQFSCPLCRRVANALMPLAEVPVKPEDSLDLRKMAEQALGEGGQEGAREVVAALLHQTRSGNPEPEPGDEELPPAVFGSPSSNTRAIEVEFLSRCFRELAREREDGEVSRRTIGNLPVTVLAPDGRHSVAGAGVSASQIEAGPEFATETSGSESGSDSDIEDGEGQDAAHARLGMALAANLDRLDQLLPGLLAGVAVLPGMDQEPKGMLDLQPEGWSRLAWGALAHGIAQWEVAARGGPDVLMGPEAQCVWRSLVNLAALCTRTAAHWVSDC